MPLKIKVHENLDPVNEGIDINDSKREISYNPKHQDNLDTSVENNPIVDKSIIPGVEVWSIFQRKWSRQGDGNPFIYALKKEKGWHFRSENDRKQIENQINAVADKFLAKSEYNATVLIPSSSNVNDYLANLIISKSKDIQRIDGLLRKLSTQEAEDYALKIILRLGRFISPMGTKTASILQWATCVCIWIK